MTPDEADALYREHAANTSREVGRVLGEPSLAEDCVHDIFVRFLSSDTPVTYKRQLLRISSVNRARDMMRRRCSTWDKRSVDTDASDVASSLVDGEGTAEDQMVADEQRALLVAALAEALEVMPEPLRYAVWQHHAEGISVPAIARKLGVQEGAIKMRLVRGRDLLRRLLSADPRILQRKL